VLFTALALGAFQVLALVGAGTASAAGTCNYVLATQTVNVVINTGTGSTLSVSDGSVAGTVDGDILFDGAACGGSPKISNTTTVQVTTTVPSGTETFVIDNTFGAPDRQFPSTITWFVDLGTGAGDTLAILGADQTDNVVVLTDTSFTMNDAAGTTAGIEAAVVLTTAGDDTVDGSALSTGVSLTAVTGLGVDWVAPGAFDGDAMNGGGQVGDTLSYGTRTTPTVIGNPAGQAGQDFNNDGDLDAADENDVFAGFLTFETGSGADTLVGTGASETFIPGDGDDDITGGGGALDAIDWSSSSAGMTIDPANGSASGQGTDTFTGPTNFIGSPADDSLIWDGTTTGFCGGDGTDKVDATAETTGQAINLDTLDNFCGTEVDDLENALGGSGNDTLTGNDTQNRLEGNDGDDVLHGGAGNDFLIGSAGNDTYDGGDGADKVSFKNSPAGVDADMLLGFATGEGDDTLMANNEILVGSQFNDSFTGGGGNVATNFRFIGNAGNDTFTGSGSNDTLKGGGGKDTLRGVGGDDTLLGAAGNDRLFGGGGTDIGKGGDGKDTCQSIEIKSSCGKKGHPAKGAPHRVVAAKLARLG
jgi:Ca2+-binding RTX toxin-like protein